MAYRRNREDPQIRKMMEEAQTARDHNSKLADKEREIEGHKKKIEFMVRTLWDCLSEMGVTREELDNKIREIEKRRWTINPNPYFQICPKCGKKVFDYTDKAFEATCMYCGQTVPMHPGDTEE